MSATGPDAAAPVRPTETAAAIHGWMIQTYGLMPGVRNVNVNTSPGFILPLSNATPTGIPEGRGIWAPKGAVVRLVTVCVVSGSLFVQVTVSPTPTESVTGVNHGRNFEMSTGWLTPSAQAPEALKMPSAAK